MRILIIEDDHQIGAVVRRGLEGARYSVDLADDGDTGLQMALEGRHDLIILDLMLPHLDGWTLCRTLRDRRVTTPILILTARDHVEERIRGLETGADDYLAKPFNFAELLARVQALLRRDHVHKSRMIRIADLEIDTTYGRVTREGCPISLTAPEYALLEVLAGDEGRVLSREALRQRVSFDDVEVHLDSLRHKVDSDGRSSLIRSVEGGAYTMTGPELAAV